MKRIMNKGRLKMKLLIRKVALAALLVVAMMGSMEVQAQTYYVFYNSTNGYIYNIDDENVGVKMDFDASCVWYTENSALSTNTSSTLRSYVIYQGTANWYLYATAGQGVTGALSVSSSSFSNWRIDSNSYLIRRGTRSSYYVNYSNSAWTSNTTEVSSNSFIAYQVTKNDVAASLTTPTISPTFKELDYNEAATFTASATTTPAYTTFTFNGNTYYYYNNTVSSSAPTATSTGVTYSWTLTGAANSYLSPTSGTGTTITVTHSTQAPDDATSTLSVTATANGLSATSTSNATITAAAPKVDPTGISITSADPMTVYVGQTGAITYSLTPNPCYNNVVFTSTNTGIATVAADGVVTGVAVGSTTITASAKNIDGTVAASATVTVNVRNKVATPVISFTPDALDNTKATATVTCATSGVTIYYTTDGSDPTSSSTEYTEPFHVNDGDEVRAIAIKTTDGTNWDNSDIASATYVSCTTDDPVITYTASGSTATVTITGEAGATIYYTTDGSTPTSSSISGTSPVTVSGVANFATVKAYAKSSTCQASGVVSKDIVFSGTSGSMVILNDLEDHSWSYYSDPDCPIRSLNPADVKITYYGNGTGNMTSSSEDGNTPNSFSENATGVKVGIASGEDQNTFVYYKTLERTDGSTATTVAGATGRCAYTTIPNPFQVRPVSGTSSTKYRGFYKWRVKSVTGGTIYTTSTGNTTIAAGGTIDAETEVYFAPTSEYGMEVELEALWAQAYVVTSNSTSGMNSSVSYERNFMVLTSSSNVSPTQSSSYAYTLSSIYPNGTSDGTTTTSTKGSTTIRGEQSGGGQGGPGGSGTTTYSVTLSSNTKFEYITFNNCNTINAAGKNLIFGRGCSGTVNQVQGVTSASNGTSQSYSATSYTLRIESGTYNNLNLTGTSYSNTYMVKFSNTLSVKCMLGNDYDRAKGDNDNLSIAPSGSSGEIYAGTPIQCSGSANRNNLTFDWYIKSGQIHSGTLGNADGGTQSIYMGSSHFTTNENSDLQYFGRRRMTIEGGNMASIAGGVDHTSGGNYLVNDGGYTVLIRMKGGTVRGSVYGAAAYSGAAGDRKFIFTGGTIGGWVAGGANGTQETGGLLTGSAALYVGGNTSVNSNRSTTVINRAVGGNVFGAGCGYGASSSSGQVSAGTTVVVADNAYIERGVYGGGSYGYTTDTSNIFVLGGTVDGKNGGVDGTTYSSTITGGVFGGACQNQGGTVNITMTGGQVNGGLYGGSNVTGNISDNVTMHVNGGQVGTSSQTANIHGGGYGNATDVNGNILLNIGAKGQTADGAMIYGDVYGGSALGNVNDAISDSTCIGLYRGTIQGNVYGGGLGDDTYAAAVRGNVRIDLDGAAFVTTYDGTNASDGSPIPATGRVFGCNNNNGTPNGTVRINVYKTVAADGSAHTQGQYEVQAVYGGGNLAAYTPTANGATSVNVYGCGESSIEYVYGGGNAAPVPATEVKVYGSYEIDYVFGGGNGKDDVNGVANPGADVGLNGSTSYGAGTATTTILGGVIHRVFGGSNTKGDVREKASVTLGDDNLQPCEFKVDQVYGAGNEAYMSGDLEITMHCIEGVTAIYGGSRKADIGSPTSRSDVVLNVYGGHYDQVFGGNNESGCIYGSITVNIQEQGCLPIEIGELYLSGNQAAYSVYGYNDDKTPKTSGPPVYEDPVLNIISATSIGEVYGGGLGSTATLYGNPHININMEQGEIDGTYEYVEGKSDVRYKDKGYDSAQTLDLGSLGTVFGGGNEAQVVGDTYIQIGTGIDANGAALTRQDAQITGNVYGGGNRAEVTGKTNVVIGH